MIEAKNISFRYGSRSALDGVSLKVEDGEFAAILGANGAGKSTLLKVMSGYLKPSPGEILINGCPASKMSPAKLAKERAVLEQESLLSSDYTVLETVLLGRYAFSPFAADDAEGRTIALAAIKSAGLEGFEDRLYTQLSGGEKRRVQLARAICQIGKDPRKKTFAKWMFDSRHSPRRKPRRRVCRQNRTAKKRRNSRLRRARKYHNGRTHGKNLLRQMRNNQKRQKQIRPLSQSVDF